MSKFALLTSSLLLVATLSGHALELTPMQVVTQSDGKAVDRYYFQDGSRRIGFRIDNNMSVQGGGGGAAFRFSDEGDAATVLAASPLTPALPFLDKSLEGYLAAAKGMVPPEAKNVEVESKADAISINDWKSYQFTFSYELFGFPYKQSVTFINYNANEQLVFRVKAPAPKYGAIYTRSYRVLNSMAELTEAAHGVGPT